MTDKWTAEANKKEDQLIAEMWAEHDRAMKDHHDKCNRINERILKAIRSVKGDEFYNDLISVIEWAEPSDQFALVDELTGDLQREDYGKIQRVWVDQWSVGDSGDSFSGHIYVKIRTRKFLKMYFEC